MSDQLPGTHLLLRHHLALLEFSYLNKMYLTQNILAALLISTATGLPVDEHKTVEVSHSEARSSLEGHITRRDPQEDLKTCLNYLKPTDASKNSGFPFITDADSD